MEIMVSIIVPVYNAEDTIVRCLNSIIYQTYSNFEVILVDDGSTDSSGAICDKYASEYDYIHVYHKKNEGVSIARKYGIQHSKGIYSIHVDSDDYIDKDELEILVDVALKSNADIVVCDYILEYKKNAFELKQGMDYECTPSSFLQKICNGIYIGTLWNKLIRTKLYHNIIYLEGINYCEDVFILVQILSKNISISYINKILYHYCYNNSSLTRKIDIKRINDRLNFIREVEKILPANIDISILKIRIKMFVLKSGLYSNKQYHDLFSDVLLNYVKVKFIRKKDYIFLLCAQYSFGYYILKMLFLLKRGLRNVLISMYYNRKMK